MKDGWIKLHRKLVQNPIYKESRAVHVWIECLLRASHQDNVFFLKRQKLMLTSGQFCMGRKEFGASVCMSPSTAWHWILQFEADKMIDIQKTRGKGSIVTIKNWKDYQADKDVDKRKTSYEQKKDIYKNDKNEKNEKKSSNEDQMEFEELKEKKEKYGKHEINNMLEFLAQITGATGWKETQAMQRINGKNLVSLMGSIGKENFSRRIEQIVKDDFHRKNCGSLAYIYRQVKGFIEKKPKSIHIPGVGTAIF